MHCKVLLLSIVAQLCMQVSTDETKDLLNTISNETVAFKHSLDNLELKFSRLYSQYESMHDKTNHNVSQLEKDLAAVDKRSTQLVSRYRRSGACAEICIHRCMPSCNLACCVARPAGMNRHTINKLEVSAAKKNILERIKAKRRKVLKSRKQVKKMFKSFMEQGSVCEKSCLVRCEPKCKFRCCIKAN